jgi:hypothetical protein
VEHENVYTKPNDESENDQENKECHSASRLKVAVELLIGHGLLLGCHHEMIYGQKYLGT